MYPICRSQIPANTWLCGLLTQVRPTGITVLVALIRPVEFIEITFQQKMQES
jgi:hypothetical protein